MIEPLLRTTVPLLLGVATAVAIDVLSRRRGLQPPGLRWEMSSSAAVRRTVVLSVLGIGLTFAVFQSVAAFGTAPEVDFEGLPVWQLFLIHGVLVSMLGVWYLCGFAGTDAVAGRISKEWIRQFGLATPRLGREVLLGLALGVAGWLVVLITVALIGLLLERLGAVEALPEEVPESIVWMASLSLPLRAMLAGSAGVFEEVFFRGFLQPRVGIPFSTLLFVLAHLSYGQPFLLVGVTLLSLGFAFVSRWRGNIWAAITAHFTFDAIQLLVLIPAALRVAGEGGG